MSRQRFETGQVRFLESHNPAWTQMMCQLVQDHGRGAQKHQDEPANNGIKLAIKLHAFDVPYQERHIRQSCLINSHSCGVENRWIALHSDHRPTWANHVGQEQSDITSSTAHIKHLHPCHDPGLLKESARERIEHLGLHL